MKNTTTTVYSSLHIDLETYSDIDIKNGIGRYTEGGDFEILLFGYAVDDAPTQVVDLASGQAIPEEVVEMIFNDAVIKWGHNSAFEMACLSQHFGVDLDVKQWRCTMISAGYLGLPLALDAVAKVLRLGSQKDAKGKGLIRYFCVPCKPTKTNGGRTRNLPHHDPEKWAQFVEYCRQDVEVEREIQGYCDRVCEVPAIEWGYWHEDQEVGRRGLYVDTPFIEGAIEENAVYMAGIHDQMIELTGLANPNSPAQIKNWISEKTGKVVNGIAKNDVTDLIADESTPAEVVELLKLRQKASNTSVAKYDTMKAYTQRDGRMRGLIQFYGANRTGRFAGRAVQIQNLKRTFDNGLEVAKEAVTKLLAGVLYDDVSELISKLVRTAIIGGEGKLLISCDFSAIEARVLAWLAGEDWVLEVFNTHGKLYEATASKMFDIPLDQISKDDRSKGKVASLALGYQGAVGALTTMGALRSGLTEEELPKIVKDWRKANPNIVKLWYNLEACAKRCILERRTVELRTKYTKLTFIYNRGYMTIVLPSGRRLHYYGASVQDGKVTFWGMDQQKKIWTQIRTYGGSLAENITQAIARDCLVETLSKLHRRGVNTIFHVHDEVIAEEDADKAHEILALMQKVMSYSPMWAKDLPLSGEGYVSKFYKKD